MTAPLRYDPPIPASIHHDVGVIDSWTSSPTTALAAVSAALLTPTHRPPPATSIVLPVNGVPLRLPVTHLPTAAKVGYQCCRYVDNGKPAGLVVSPLAHAGAESHHGGPASHVQRRSSGIPGDLVFYETAQRFKRLQECVMDRAGELVDASRVE
jgi:hypothetical protein